MAANGKPVRTGPCYSARIIVCTTIFRADGERGRTHSQFSGDGGFGASSDLDWGLVADVRYWLSWTPLSTRPYLAAGYRVVAFDRTPSAASVDLQLRGPLAGMGFAF
jgi:hypothetical protein